VAELLPDPEILDKPAGAGLAHADARWPWLMRRAGAVRWPRPQEGDALPQRRATAGGRRALAALLLAVALAGGCAPSTAQRAQVCERALRALEAGDAPRLVDANAAGDQADTVILRYRLPAAGHPRELEIACRFAPPGPERSGLELEGVRTEREGELSPVAIYLLNRYGLGPPARPDGTGGALTPGAYLAQQLVNALAPASIYALLATGFALIWGVTGRINLAFGDFATVGAYAALSGVLLAAAAAAAVTAGGLPAGMAAGGFGFALLAGAALGAVLFALVFAPLRGRGSQALLIATVGLAISLGEALRLLAGSRQHWFQPLFNQRLGIGGGEGAAAVVVNGSQVALAGLALAVIGSVVLVLRRSAFGRAYRACADDADAAALVGVDVDRTVRGTCMLGSAVAAVAGFAVAIHYGVVSFGMGTLWGFKALTAAVVGGIGSVPGAALGGVLVGVLESLWGGYLPAAYKEVAVFALLALMLAVRPNGLFGQPGSAENPMLWRTRPPG
jgi:branched-chain amino acid transport system permease protein